MLSHARWRTICLCTPRAPGRYIYSSEPLWRLCLISLTVAHLRDLGSALSVSAARVTSYSYNRLVTGVKTAPAVRILPHDKEKKGQLIIRSAHKQSFYGCESSQVDLTILANYISEVLRTTGASSQQRSRSLTFGFSDLPYHIDPYIEIFLWRITLLRRYLVKNPHEEVLFAHNYSAYAKLSYTGIHNSSIDLSSFQPAPLPGDAGRDDWAPAGPIGLLLEHTHHLGATVDLQTHTLRAHDVNAIHFLTLPFQLLRPIIAAFAFDRVFLAHVKNRTVLRGLSGIDIQVFRKTLRVPDGVDGAHYKWVLQTVAILASVDNVAFCRFRATDDDTCRFCGNSVSSVHHILFHCIYPRLVEARHGTTDDNQKTILRHLDVMPLPLLYGIQPKMRVMPSTPWW